MTEIRVQTSGVAAEAVTATVPTLVEERFASKLFAQDADLWGSAAREESSKRLGWVDLVEESRQLIGPIEQLRAELAAKGVDHVVLCGMGGSSLAPEVIGGSYDVPITVLDSSQPDMVRAALQERLDSTVVVVSSKSGSTLETDSQRRAYVQAFQDAGIDPTERIVIVTDPGSPLEQQSEQDGYRVFRANPDVGGRYSALTAFGLVPSGLAGADIKGLLDDAEKATAALSADDADNPGLQLGAAIAGTRPLRDKLVLLEQGTPHKGFGDWAEQLVAESTGKDGKGLLPVVLGGAPAAAPTADELFVGLVDSPGEPTGEVAVTVSGSLGGSFLLWEVATAVAGRLLGINPFDQPDVESAKQAARDLMAEGSAGSDDPAFTDGAVEVRSHGDFLGDAATVDDALKALVAQVGPQGYLAVMAYLDRIAHSALADIRQPLARSLARPVTFGWGPRFLHSTGQYHKGGPSTGVYLQITAQPQQDLQVPGRDFTFGEFIAAQAGGDAKVLGDHERPVLRLHLTDFDDGIVQVMKAVRSVSS